MWSVMAVAREAIAFKAVSPGNTTLTIDLA